MHTFYTIYFVALCCLCLLLTTSAIAIKPFIVHLLHLPHAVARSNGNKNFEELGKHIAALRWSRLSTILPLLLSTHTLPQNYGYNYTRIV